uniref:Uncharacterized protein n=1 Tax=Lepeophtheirus salmonis TaxID=72036 RepID=A0A0K2UH28_LEPSM
MCFIRTSGGGDNKRNALHKMHHGIHSLTSHTTTLLFLYFWQLISELIVDADNGEPTYTVLMHC